MNKMSGYFSTLALAALVLGLGALCLSLLNGLGTSIYWLEALSEGKGDNTEPSTVSNSVLVSAQPLETYSETWTRPLFNPTRQPDPGKTVPVENAIAPPLDGLKLTGVVFSHGLKIALLKDADGRSFNVREGQALPNGWIIETIESRKIHLVYEQIRQSLAIPVLRLPPLMP